MLKTSTLNDRIILIKHQL